MGAPVHLAELARQVRAGTLQLLEAAQPAWLTRAPPGTSNHMLWHAGHALWLQDALCIEPLTGSSELPDGWAETFGMRCRPVAATRHWPDRREVHRRLTGQLQRMLELFAEHEQRLRNSSELSRGVIHGLHDEARHQGEMYLLWKLCRAGMIGDTL
jgi:hypothetical protein